jgi:Lon protease-like protein
VALPGEAIPLHIFEQRYRTMVERCLEAGRGTLERSFGIIWLSDEELKSVGCACEVEAVIERLKDGRLNILVRGGRPFRLLQRQEELPYPAGEVEFLDDEDEEPDGEARQAAEDAYRELVRQATDREMGEEELAQMDAYRMAGTVELPADEKQALLELRSENDRLRSLSRLLVAALERLEVIDRAQARAMSNGKVRFG